jgi:hypothetical protein
VFLVPTCDTHQDFAWCRYVPLLRSGDKLGGNTYGLLTDSKGKGLELEGEPYISNGAGAASVWSFSSCC